MYDTARYIPLSIVASIVVPIRAGNADDPVLKRLERLLGVIPNQFEVIVVDDGSPRGAKAAIRNLTAYRPDVQLISLKTRWKRFSLARARNCGVWAATTDVLVFHDVDFIGSPIIYQRLAREITGRQMYHQAEQFFCVPVAFLTDQSTREYLEHFPTEFNPALWKFDGLEPKRGDTVLNFVRGSSCIVANRENLISMGGHDESYDGHGAEDFELLHRLSKRFPIADKPADYSLNTGSGVIDGYRGFRAYFALYGDACLQSGCILVHLYHPPRKLWGYYQDKRNFAKLRSLMEADESRSGGSDANLR